MLHLLPALRTGFGALDVSLRETLTPALLAELRKKRIDLALPLFEERMSVVQPEVPEGPVKAAALAGARLLLLEEGHCFRNQAWGGRGSGAGWVLTNHISADGGRGSRRDADPADGRARGRSG